MKPGQREQAIETLRICGVPRGSDFHTLNTYQVDALIEAADRMKYRKPRNANGSRARYFHDMLQRRARRLKGEREFRPCSGQRGQTRKYDWAICRVDHNPPWWRARDRAGRLRTFPSGEAAERAALRLEAEK